MKITPENIAVLSQEQVDQIYGRLTAGPDPRRPAIAGNLFFARGDRSREGELRPRLEEIVGGIEGPRSPAPRIEMLEASAARCGRARCSIATSASCAT